MTDKEVLKLINPREFIAAWFKALPQHSTYREAYEDIEAHYVRVFGRRKYSCYQSFEVVKKRIAQVKKK